MSDWITSKMCDSILQNIVSNSFTSLFYISLDDVPPYGACNLPIYEARLQKYIRMRLTIYKIFIWGGIFSDIWLEITFNSSDFALQ